MKKEKRIPYLALIHLDIPIPPGNPCLCQFCKYGEWYGNCGEAELECQHRLEVIGENSFAIWAGKDCWGFRPDISPDVAADIVGYWLRGENVDWATVPLIGKQK